MEGLTRTTNVEERLFNGTSVQPLIGGGSTNFSFTLVADKPVDANFWMGAGPVELRDWNGDNNTREAKLAVAVATAGTTTPPAAQPVVGKKTPAPAKHQSADVKDLASTGASPMIPVILALVLLAADGALLFVLRRRVSRR